MARPRKKKMGRPFEDVPLRKLVKSLREDIHEKLAETISVEPALEARKPKKK
jgi:hypothetical protein